jgi:hypothetical protein
MHKYFAISVVLICTAYNCVSQTTPSQSDLYRVSRILHDYHGPSNRTDSVKFDDRLEVVLANDSVIRVKGALTTIDESHFYLKATKYKPNKGKIKPSDTKEISRYTYSGLKITGIAADSCWLFKVETGRINSYSYYPDEYPGRIVAIQKGSGPIVPYNKQNLLAMVSDDPDIVVIVEEGLYMKAIDMYNNDD